MRGALVAVLLAACGSDRSGPRDAGLDAPKPRDAGRRICFPDGGCYDDLCWMDPTVCSSPQPNPVEPAAPLRCPSQGTGRYCATGIATRFVDDGLRLDQRRFVKGACARVYSPTDLVVGNVQPLGTPAEARLDDGFFLIQDIPETSTKFVAVVIDDCGEPPGRTLSGTYAAAFVAGEQVSGQSTIDMTSSQTTAVAITTEEARALVAQAGRDVYGVGGSYIMIFRDPRSSSYPPVQGVQPFGVSDDYINSTNAIHFGADLAHLDPMRPFAAGTGPTGAVLIHPPHVTQHSGRGDVNAIAWDTILGGAADGSFFVQRWRLKRQ